MKLTLTTLTDLVFTLEVNEEMEIENLKALCSLETNISVESMTIFYNGNQLSDGKKTISQFGIKDGDMLLVQDRPSTMSNNPFPNIDFSSLTVPPNATNSLDQLRQNPRSEAINIFETLRSNPEQVAVLRINNPRLAHAFDGGIEEFITVLSEQQKARDDEEKHKPKKSHPESIIQEMVGMGFNRNQVITELDAFDGDKNLALASLFAKSISIPSTNK
ncbi:hypothetical protein RDWZM_003024 [Blomia tropicalis]|uniref:Uncharacterized protein n=1 Tax=Blomia tropicalis TaxID=40697 RepID=A0A9Q0MFB2_BLOTA|nr:hypothetical protein RDWZM_003024 [Blomia tropicalis]